MKSERIDRDLKAVTITLSGHELLMVNNALNEVCHGIEVPEFSTRLGADVVEVKVLLEQVHQLLEVMRAGGGAREG